MFIDADAGAVADVEYGGLADMRRMVGGHLELGRQWANGDVLYVGGRARLGGGRGAFMLPGAAWPYVGNGVIVGAGTEAFTAEGYPVTADPVASALGVRLVVRWGAWKGAGHGC